MNVFSPKVQTFLDQNVLYALVDGINDSECEYN